MTKGDAIKIIGISEQTYDTAIPETWVDAIREKLGLKGFDLVGNLVWLYDQENRTFGRPCALTIDGNNMLERINTATGSRWPLTPNPADPDQTWCDQCFKQPEDSCPCYAQATRASFAWACKKAAEISTMGDDPIHVWKAGRYYEWGDEAYRQLYSAGDGTGRDSPAVRSYKNGQIVCDNAGDHTTQLASPRP